MQKNETGFLPYTIHKNQLKTEENIQKKLQDIGLGSI
jgi:hypothetical protein